METPVDANMFLQFLKQECDNSGVKYLFPETAEVSYPGSENMMVSGYFADKPEPLLACAIGKPVEQWFEILVHESCHMDQWIEQGEVWDDLYLNGHDCDKEMDEWLSGKEFTEEEAAYFIRIMQTLEIDCEKRAIEKIKHLNLSIDITNYIKKANSYLFFYTVMLQTKKWCDIAPYNIPEIVEMMPDYFFDEDEQYHQISNALLVLYKEKCYKPN